MRFEVYVPDHETEVIAKLNEETKKNHRSPYIVGLVKDNLNGKKSLTEEEVITLIIKYTQNKNTIPQSQNIDLGDSIKSALDLLD